MKSFVTRVDLIIISYSSINLNIVHTFQWSTTPLADNTPTDLYHYRMVVYTGGRRHAATSSNVFFMVVGDEGETEVRKLESSPNKKV